MPQEVEEWETNPENDPEYRPPGHVALERRARLARGRKPKISKP